MNATDHNHNYDAFIQKITQVVMQNLDNDQFGVTDLAQNIGLSRSQLHRKLKTIKNQSVSQFINTVRLEEAVKLLKNDNLTISEIAYQVGFSSPTYFHKCFRQHFQCAPGDYKKISVLKSSQPKPVTEKSSPDKNLTLRQKLFHLVSSRKLIVTLVILLLLMAGFIYQKIFHSNSQKSIAILPLYNYTGDPEDDNFVRGFHDGLIGTLGQVSNIRVISRTSTLEYEAKNLPLQKIAKELGVELVVEGSLSGSGDQKYLQLQLIEAFPHERHLWSKKYRHDLANVILIEKNIARSILQKLEIALTPNEEKLLKNAYAINPEAYKAYVKGMIFWDQLSEYSLNAAMDQFDLALEYDPEFAPAYAGKSLVWIGRLQEGLTPYNRAVVPLDVAANKALALDSTLFEAYYALAIASCWVEWDYLEAEQEFRKAIAINPNYSHARAYLAHVLNILQQSEQAIEQMEIAVQLDPFNPLIQALQGMNLNFTRQYNKAQKIMERTLSIDPDNPVALSTLRTTYHLNKLYPEALKIWKTCYRIRGDDLAIEALESGESTGGYSGALESLAYLLIARRDTTHQSPWPIATLFTRAGNLEQALAWLQKAYDAHDSNMPYIGVDPIFDYLHDDSRFQQLLKDMNLTPTGLHLTSSLSFPDATY